MDLHRLADQHRQYLRTLEDTFLEVLAQGKATLPPCMGHRRLLAVEYARLHWRLGTACSKDKADGWWSIALTLPVKAASKQSHPQPHPLLSELVGAVARAKSDQSEFVGAPVGAQPRLRFAGVRGAGDELYDLVGSEGLLGIRPGEEAGELFAFFDRSACASAVATRLTGHANCGTEPRPVRRAAPTQAAPQPSAWGLQPPREAARPATMTAAFGLRVSLENTLGAAQPDEARRRSKEPPAGAQTCAGPGVDAPVDNEDVPDSWEALLSD